MGCKYEEYIGHCSKPCKKGSEYCEQHARTVCVSCGEQATTCCFQTMSLVCGAPLCGKKSCQKKHDEDIHRAR